MKPHARTARYWRPLPSAEARHYQVSIEDALAAHENALADDGGLPGLLDRNALLSALGRPYHGYHPELYQKAAALIHAIVKNHAFVDGNKRTAFHLAMLLIRRSRYALPPDIEDFVQVLCDVAAGAMDYDDLEEWLRVRIFRPRA